MPTGGGKSVCFQIPAMINEGICLVISPGRFNERSGCQFAEAQHQRIALTGGKSDEMIDLLDNCQFGNYKFLFIS
jgi:ATP-dependent DNA helicase RecQ